MEVLIKKKVMAVAFVLSTLATFVVLLITDPVKKYEYVNEDGTSSLFYTMKVNNTEIGLLHNGYIWVYGLNKIYKITT
jgi:hypothetical protein